MNFLPDIFTTLSYAAVIPVYALFVFILASKKRSKSALAGNAKFTISSDSSEIVSQVKESSIKITTSDGKDLDLSNLVSKENKAEDSEYEILHKLVEIGVKKEVEGCYDEELISLSWYRAN